MTIFYGTIGKFNGLSFIFFPVKHIGFFILILTTFLSVACGKFSFNAGLVTKAEGLEMSSTPPRFGEKFLDDEDQLPRFPPSEEKHEVLTVEDTPEDYDPSQLAEGSRQEDFKRGGIITPTIYYNPIYQDSVEKCDSRRSLMSTNGTELMSVCPKVAKECGLQGSCTIEKDGVLRLFNINGRKDGVDHFFEMDREECKYGFGVRELCLVPYHTVAADLTIYKPGQVLFIPALVGAKLPNGKIHDGFLVIRDQGRGIKGAGRFDFFTGFAAWKDASNPFVKLGLSDKETDMVFYLVTGPSAQLGK